jgi:hypothetical protein
MEILHVSRLPPPARELDLPALVGAGAWARLPPAVQRRFAHATHDTTYRGELVLHCSRIGHLFAWVGRLFGGPLAAGNCAAPAVVRVRSDGLGGVVWERHLLLAGHDRLVRSTKSADGTRGIVERTDGGLSMALKVFEDAGALVFESRRYFLSLGPWRLPIPMALAPGVCRVEHHDLGGGRFRFVLSMVHPWWGTTFVQDGEFHDPEVNE